MSWHTIDPTWNTVPDTDAIKSIIFNKGPVATSICSLSAFNNYKGGIFTTNETCGGSRTNHAVILTGWITDPTYGTVWILRNSWGTWWGDEGYMYVKAGTSSVGWNATYVEFEMLEDKTPPKVIKLDSVDHTSGNVIVDNEEISVGLTQLLVSFSEAMYYENGVNDVLTLTNYTLTSLGADGQVGGGDDDDDTTTTTVVTVVIPVTAAGGPTDPLIIPVTGVDYLPFAGLQTLSMNLGLMLFGVTMVLEGIDRKRSK